MSKCMEKNFFVSCKGKLVDEYLHDFDVFHVEQVAELLHYMDGKYLSAELGGKHIC